MTNTLDRPNRGIIEITSRCNMACLHCFANKNTKELDWKEWVGIINKLIDAKVQSISITGGEPLLYPWLFDLMEAVDYKDCKITIDTNASLINEDNVKLFKKYFKLIRISIVGWGDDQQKNSRNIKFTYNELLSKLKLVTSYKMPLQVNIPMFNNTVEKFEQYIDEIINLSPHEIVLIPIILTGKANKLTGKDLPTNKKIELLFEKYFNKYGSMFRLFKWAEGKHFVIRSQGDTYLHPFFDTPNNELYLGNIKDNSLDNLWNKVDMKYKIANRDLTPDISDLPCAV